MKKIICLLLALVFSFVMVAAMVACSGDGDNGGDNSGDNTGNNGGNNGGDNTGDNTGDNNEDDGGDNEDNNAAPGGENIEDKTETVEPVDIILAAVEKASPTKITTLTQRAGDMSLDGEFVTEIQGLDLIFTYSYEIASDPMSLGEEVVTMTGKLYYMNGKLVSSEGDGIVAGAPITKPIVLALKKEYLVDAEVSEDGTVLEAEITAENAVKAFGTDLNADGNLTVKVVIDGERINYFDISCTTESGATVLVRTSYTYESIELVFPSAE